MSERRKLLEEAADIITKDRNMSYNEPEDSFQLIADLWSATNIQPPYTRVHIAIFLSLLKIARLVGNPSYRDSWLDLAGYTGCGWDCAIKDESEKKIDTEIMTVIQSVSDGYYPQGRDPRLYYETDEQP